MVYSKANFAAINEELCVFIDSFLLTFDQRTVQYNWNLFKEIVHRLTNSYIPCRVIKYVVQSPWYNVTLYRLANKKNHLFRAAKGSTRKSLDIHKQAEQNYNNAVRGAKFAFFTTTLPSMLVNNTRQFWNVVNQKEGYFVSLTDGDGYAYLLNALYWRGDGKTM
ncbi:MAG: hypothetical protein O7D30_08095, partial [Rickettsia endosymbiont of Ixodes persulcatus]|nr:hypothetical protein [Rickettsia endosymbiont of Ixodes persulcatus]